MVTRLVSWLQRFYQRFDSGWRWVKTRPRAFVADRVPFSLYIRVASPDAKKLVARVAKRSSSPFTFVQVGSNDGRTDDPLFATVTQREVRGILVEPIPELFERLNATYADTPGLILVKAAVAEDEVSREFYWVPPTPSDPIWIDQLGSFSQEVILSHTEQVPGISDRIKTVSVQCRTLSSLIREHGLSRIDLLHIDAEGYDLSILKTVHFSASWSPRFILYEQKHLGPQQTSALALLHRVGYRTVDLGADVFAFRGLKARIEIRARSALNTVMLLRRHAPRIDRPLSPLP